MISKYRLQRVSDISSRDGLGVEMVDEMGHPVAEIFRSDSNSTLMLSTFGNEISLGDIEVLIIKAKTELEPFENGRHLSDALPGIIQKSRAQFGTTADE